MKLILLLLLFVAGICQCLSNYTSISLTVYARGGTIKLYATQKLYFDLSGSIYPQQLNSNYYFYFQFDEYVLKTGKPSFLLLGPLNYTEAITLKVPYTYRTGGLKQANVTVSDRPFRSTATGIGPSYKGSKSLFSVTSSGLPAPIATSRLFLFDRNPDCARFQFDMLQPSPLYKILRVQAIGLDDDDDRTAAEMTKMYHSLGELPDFTLYNLTLTTKLNVSTNLDSGGHWYSIVPTEYFDTNWDLILRVKSQNVVIGGCRLSEQKFQVTSHRKGIFSFGYAISNSSWVGRKIGRALIEARFQPKYLKIEQGPCFSNEVMVPLGNIVSNNATDPSISLGSIVLATIDAFDSDTEYLDLSRNAVGSMSLDEYTICVGLTRAQCLANQIIQVNKIRDKIIFLTSYGVVTAVTTSLLFNRMDSSLIPYLNLTQSLDVTFWSRCKISSLSNCFPDEPVFFDLFFPMDINTDAGYSSLVSSQAADFMKGNFSVILKVSDLNLDPRKYSFVSFTRQENMDRNYYLLGMPTSSFSGSDISYSNALLYWQIFVIEAANFSPSTIQLARNFSQDSRYLNLIVTGMKFHHSWMDLFIYGNTLIHSPNYGFSLDMIIPYLEKDGEVIAEFRSNSFIGEYVLYTNYNRVLYGSLVNNQVFQLPIPRNFDSVAGSSNSSVLTDLFVLKSYMFTSTNLLVQLNLPIPSYNRSLALNSTKLFPYGLLRDSNATLNNKPLIRLVVPINSHIQLLDFAAKKAASALLVFFKTFSVATFESYFIDLATGNFSLNPFFATPEISVQNFGPRDLNTGLLSSLSCVTEAVEERFSSTSIDCSLEVGFTGESSDDSPILLANNIQIDLIGPGGGNNNLIVSIRKVSNSNDQAAMFLSSDVGHTLFTQQRSFLITQVINATNAIGITPSTVNCDSCTFPVISSEFRMFDFGPWKEFARPGWNQTLRVTPNDTFSYFVTLNQPGRMIFESKHENMLLILGNQNDQFGVVDLLLNSSTILLRSFYQLNGGSSTFFGPGNWSLVRPTQDYIWGYVPTDTNKQKSWSITPPPCPILDVASESQNPSLLVESLTNVTTFLSMNMSHRQLDYPENGLFTYVEDTRIVSASNINGEALLDQNLNLNSTIFLMDQGSPGRTGLSFRTKSFSAKCINLPECEMPLKQVFVKCDPLSFLHANDLVFQSFYDESSMEEIADPSTASSSVVSTYPDDSGNYIILPPNYRPPSYLGLQVPTSQSFYNADPTKPTHNNFYEISRKSGSFKQCANASTQADCGCTTAMKYSQKQAFSDCISLIPAVNYADVFRPNIDFSKGTVKSYDFAYQLVELNNRSDYCFSGFDKCGNVQAVKDYVCTNSTGITWSGSQLFHFRLVLVQGSYCPLVDEFTVYVKNTPLPKSLSDLALTGTAGLFGVISYLVYLVFIFRK